MSVIHPCTRYTSRTESIPLYIHIYVRTRKDTARYHGRHKRHGNLPSDTRRSSERKNLSHSGKSSLGGRLRHDVWYKLPRAILVAFRMQGYPLVLIICLDVGNAVLVDVGVVVVVVGCQKSEAQNGTFVSICSSNVDMIQRFSTGVLCMHNLFFNRSAKRVHRYILNCRSI
jgi:hypothetical protein